MKTEAQILRYTAQCSFAKDDWQQVLNYCRSHFGGGKAHKSQSPLSESTYKQFLDWIDNGVSVGDIVGYGNTLGVVGGYSPKAAYLSAYLSLDNRLIVDRLDVAPSKLSLATPEEIEKFEKLLQASSLRFSVATSAFAKAYIPADGDFVRISKDKKILPAIYKSDDGNNYIFHAVVSGKKVIQNEVDSKNEVVILPPTKTGILRLLEALSVNGLAWSAKDKCMSNMPDKRAKVRGRYYYVTDTFDIESDADTYTKVHDRRFKCGNYFPNFQEAFRFREQIVELIKRNAEEKNT